MSLKENTPIHTFHIPVMGTGFTIDTPLRVARYGISSVMSVEDNLMEKMREHYCPLFGEVYTPIPKHSPDSRAERITEYLNFLGRVVARQIKDIKAAPFEKGSEITKYFELLDDASPLVRGAAVWALSRLVERDELLALAGEVQEPDASVREEWLAAGSIPVEMASA